MKKRKSWKKAVVLGIALAMGVMPQAFAAELNIDSSGPDDPSWVDGNYIYYGPGTFTDVEPSTGQSEDDESSYVSGNTINVTGNTTGYDIYGALIDDSHSNIDGDEGTTVTVEMPDLKENTINVRSGSIVGNLYGAYGLLEDDGIYLYDVTEGVNFTVTADTNEVNINASTAGNVTGGFAQISVASMEVTFTADELGEAATDAINFTATATNNTINIINGSTVTATDTGAIYGGYANISGGEVDVSHNATATDANDTSTFMAAANNNTVNIGSEADAAGSTANIVTGDIYGGYAHSGVDYLSISGGTSQQDLGDRVVLDAQADNNKVNIMNSTVTTTAVTGGIYGGYAAVTWSGQEEYFGRSAFEASGNAITLDNVLFTGATYVYASYLYVDKGDSTSEGELTVRSAARDNSITVTGTYGATDLTSVNLYGAYPDFQGLTPSTITGNSLTMDGTWLDATAAASSDVTTATATINSVNFFDSINLTNLNFTMTDDNKNGDKIIDVVNATGMGGLQFLYEDEDDRETLTGATFSPVTITATAASASFDAMGEDLPVETPLSSNITLQFDGFTHNNIESRNVLYTSTGVNYSSFDTSSINTTAESVETLTDGSGDQTGVRVHIMELTANDDESYGSVTASLEDPYTLDTDPTEITPTDGARTYTYNLTGTITDSILTGRYTSSENTAGDGNLILGSGGITSTTAEIIAGSYSSTGAATDGNVTISDGFSAGTGRIDRNQTDDTINIFAGYSTAAGGSVSGNTVTLNGNSLSGFNFYGYNDSALKLYDESAGTSGGSNVLNISAAGDIYVNNIGYFDTYSFDISAEALAAGTYQNLTVNNNFYGDKGTLVMKIDTESNKNHDYVYVQGTHTGTTAIRLYGNGEDLTKDVIGTILVSVNDEQGEFTRDGVYEGALVWQTYTLESATSAVPLGNDETLEYDGKGTDWYIDGVTTAEETEPGPDEDNPDDNDDGDEGDKDTEPGPSEPPDDGDEGDKDTEPGPAEPPDDGDDGDGGPGPAQPTGNTTTVNTVIASNAVNYYAFRETDKLLRRMGELRNNGEDEQGVWIRVKGAKTGRDNSFENKYTHYELGYDQLVKNDHREKRYEGVSLSYMDGSVKYSGISGSGKAHDEEIAFYRVDQYKHGHYLDLVARIGMYSNRFGVYDTNQNKIHGKNDTYGISMSAEYGRKKDYAHGWYIEPQGQLTIGYLSGNDYTTSNQVDVSNGCISSLVGRVGANFGKNFGREKKGIVYLKANWLHEFLGTYSIDMVSNAGNRVHAHGDYRDNWFEYGLGVAYKYTKNNFVYADIERTAGSDYYKNWAWNVGLRWTFN